MIGPHWARIAAVSLAAVATSCSSQAQTAPVYRDSTPTEATTATVREEFDPARHRQDLLLIEPLFPPPEVPSPDPDVATDEVSGSDSVVTDTALPAGVDSLAAADIAANLTYRVQVIALRNETNAHAIADELHRRFAVAADVVPLGELFAVQAGFFADRNEADELRRQIVPLSQGYSGAYIISEEVDIDPDGIDRPVSELPVAGEPDSSALDPPALEAVTDTTTEQAAPVELVLVQGYRVLLGQFMDLQSAQGDRTRVIKRLKREDVEVIFEAPWYKVLAGSFRTSTEATRFAERCRSLGYRTAAPVRGDVYLPREGGSR